jgi:hypothetical protein
VDERVFARDQLSPREHSWILPTTVTALRELIGRYLDGERGVGSHIEELSSAIASAARDNDVPPERMLIAMRALWKDFSFAQHDRLQLAALYDRIVKRAIDKYYGD